MGSAAALRFAEPRVPKSELGSPGTRFFAGYLGSDEYVPELRGRRALDTYDRMRRSDPTVKALLQAIKLPLLGATWDVEPASADAADAAVAAFVRWNLFAGMSMTWEEHLRHLLTHLDFGFYVGEIVWDVRDDLAQAISLSPVDGISAPTSLFERPMAVVRKLAPRLQRTIERWWLARDGGLERVAQRVYGAGQNEAVDIPVERLLVFSNEKEGADFTGRSVLRPAYKPWFIKDQLERIFAIAAERHGVGIPVMEVDAQSYNDDNVRDAEDILSSVRAHEKGYIVEIPGLKFRIEGMGQGRALDVEPAIGRLSREILVGGLAQFIALGGGPAGSFALSEDQTSMFMRNERALAAYVAGVHDRYLIPKLVDLNFAGVRRYPRLVVTNIQTRDAEKLLNALAVATNVGLVSPDRSLEDALRARLDLPRRAPAAASVTGGAADA